MKHIGKAKIVEKKKMKEENNTDTKFFEDNIEDDFGSSEVGALDDVRTHIGADRTNHILSFDLNKG